MCWRVIKFRFLSGQKNHPPTPTCNRYAFDLVQLQTRILKMSRKLTLLCGLQGCSKLAHLRLRFCCEISTLEPLRACQKLAKLSLSGCPISSLEPLQTCSKLRDLSLYGCRAGNLPGMNHLRGLPNLKINGV